MKRLVVGLSGASGCPLAIDLLSVMREQPDWETHLVWSDGFARSLSYESDKTMDELCAMADVVYRNDDLGAAIASGTFQTEGMVVIPCSMKTVAGIACGYSDNLLLRAADVTIKEGRRLVLAARESPLSPIHLKNMLYLSELGVRIVPPMIAYYANTDSVQTVTRQAVGRVLNEFGISAPGFQRWA